MLEKIQSMLAEALDLPVEKVTPDAKIVDDLGADSLDVVELLSQLEDEFGIIIPEPLAIAPSRISLPPISNSVAQALE